MRSALLLFTACVGVASGNTYTFSCLANAYELAYVMFTPLFACWLPTCPLIACLAVWY